MFPHVNLWYLRRKAPASNGTLKLLDLYSILSSPGSSVHQSETRALSSLGPLFNMFLLN